MKSKKNILTPEGKCTCPLCILDRYMGKENSSIEALMFCLGSLCAHEYLLKYFLKDNLSDKDNFNTMESDITDSIDHEKQFIEISNKLGKDNKNISVKQKNLIDTILKFNTNLYKNI